MGHAFVEAYCEVGAGDVGGAWRPPNWPRIRPSGGLFTAALNSERITTFNKCDVSTIHPVAIGKLVTNDELYWPILSALFFSGTGPSRIMRHTKHWRGGRSTVMVKYLPQTVILLESATSDAAYIASESARKSECHRT